MTRTVTIAGLGLIGGSLGKALRRQGWRVLFVDPRVSLADALAAGAADEKRETLDGDLVVLATPADVALGLVANLTAPLVTSVSSVMLPLRNAAHHLNFVAGHPFAGSELSGLHAAQPDLFHNKTWFVDREEPAAMEMIHSTGAKVVVVDAEEHDRMMAMTSHLPQVVATALAAMLDAIDPQYIGSGARSMLRLAGSDYSVWQSVLEANDTNIAAAAEELWRTMQRIGPEEFARAQRFYRSVNPASGERPER
jgi:prephenate dehydrogenase